MNFNRQSAFIGLLIAVCLYPNSYSRASEFTFSQAWVQLQQVNDGLAASQANREEAVYLQEAAKALYFPKIDLKAGYTRLDDDVTLAPSQLFDAMPAGETLNNYFGTIPGLAGNLDEALTVEITEKNVITASLVAVWPIYTGGRIRAAQDIAGGQLMQADYLVRLKRQALFEKLSKIYFGVVLRTQLLLTRNDAEKGLLKHLVHAKKLEAQGQIAKVERLKAEASHAQAKVDRNKAQKNLELARLALNRLLQETISATPSNGLFINDDIPELVQITDATLENHPGLGVLKAMRIQAQGLVQVKKGAYLPEAFLYGNYKLYEQDTLSAQLIPEWLVGIGISAPLSSRDGRSGKLKAAKSKLSKLDHLKSQAIIDLGLLVEKTWREAQLAQEEYNGLASSLELAYENIRMREISFSQGLSTSLEVVDAELFLVNVKTQQQVAAYQYVLSLARLLALSNQMNSFSDYQMKGRS